MDWPTLAGKTRWPKTDWQQLDWPKSVMTSGGGVRRASTKVHKQHREEVVWPLLSSSQRASVRSQSGPLASVPFTSFPTCRVTRMESEPFRVLLLRRLRMPLPVFVRSCVCGRHLDLFGHHWAACTSAGEVLLSKALRNRSAGKQEPKFPQTS